MSCGASDAAGTGEPNHTYITQHSVRGYNPCEPRLRKLPHAISHPHCDRIDLHTGITDISVETGMVAIPSPNRTLEPTNVLRFAGQTGLAVDY